MFAVPVDTQLAEPFAWAGVSPVASVGPSTSFSVFVDGLGQTSLVPIGGQVRSAHAARLRVRPVHDVEPLRERTLEALLERVEVAEVSVQVRTGQQRSR